MIFLSVFVLLCFVSSLYDHVLALPDGPTGKSGALVPIKESSSSSSLLISNVKASPTQRTFGFIEDTKSGQVRFVEQPEATSTEVSANIAKNGNDDDDTNTLLGSSQQRQPAKKNYHIKATILSILMAALWLMIPVAPPTLLHEVLPSVYILRGLVTFLYLLECLLCSTRRYLSNSLSPHDLQAYLTTLQQAAPRIVWWMECYHYRHVRRYTTSSSGRRRHSTSHRERVVTHRARKEFVVDRWQDVTDTQPLERAVSHNSHHPDNPFSASSNDSDNNDGDSATFVKTSLSKQFWLTTPSLCHRYLMDKELFHQQESHYDIHHEFSMKLELHQNDHDIGKKMKYRNKILVVRTGLSDVAMASPLWFWVASFLGLTVPYRMWFARHCLQTQLDVVKELEE